MTCIDRMEFDAEGLIKPIKLTHQGVESRALGKSTADKSAKDKHSPKEEAWQWRANSP